MRPRHKALAIEPQTIIRLCPVFFGDAKCLHRDFEDPAALQGTEEERPALFRRVRDEIRDYLKTFPS